MTVDVRHGDCREVIKTLADDSIHAVVTDPPYGLQFMGREWDKLWRNSTEADAAYVVHMKGELTSRARKLPDYSVSNPQQMQTWHEQWARQVFRVLKPGGHLVAFSGTRTYHRMVCAIEDAGFEIRDQIGWLYGSGFPKSHDVSKAIDRAAGAEREIVGEYAVTREFKGRDYVGEESHATTVNITAPATDTARQWEGWGTALKPAWEPIVLARKPLIGTTVAANVLAHGTGAINVDGCRVATDDGYADNAVTQGINTAQTSYEPRRERRTFEPAKAGRWPANIIHDGSEEVIAAFPESDSTPYRENIAIGDVLPLTRRTAGGFADTGSAARFFYTAKADSDDRLGSKHPTVKPVDLMAYLVRLVTPPGGTVLDPFAGSGTTGMACMREGFDCILIEREAEYVADIKARLAHVHGDDLPLFDMPLTRAELDADARGNYELALEELRRR